MQTGALQALLETVLGPDSTADGRRPGSGGEGNSPVKIALFSIGNMCAHKECRCVMVVGAASLHRYSQLCRLTYKQVCSALMRTQGVQVGGGCAFMLREALSP
jgi:hypothetical protein